MDGHLRVVLSCAREQRLRGPRADEARHHRALVLAAWEPVFRDDEILMEGLVAARRGGCW